MPNLHVRTPLRSFPILYPVDQLWCTLNFTKGFIIKSRSIFTPSQFSIKSFQLSPDSTWLLSRLYFLFQELPALSQLFMVNFAQLYFIPRISKTLSGLFRHVSFIYYSPWGLFSPLVSHDHSSGVTAWGTFFLGTFSKSTLKKKYPISKYTPVFAIQSFKI